MRRAVPAVVVLLAAFLLGLPPAFARQRPPRVGLLIADHGEPPRYNEDTYRSFRAFFRHLVEMGVIPWWVTLVDEGTVLQDRDCPQCGAPSADPRLIDAWLHPYDGPATWVPASESTPAHYIAPGGPGLGEPDFYEHAGLQVWHEWELMGGTSPNYAQKLPRKRAVIRAVRARFGIPVAVGYGIDPWLRGRSQGFRRAVTRLVRGRNVDHIVVAYHGVGFSDIMQTHMVRHRITELAHRLDDSVTLSWARPIGTTRAFLEAVARKVGREVAAAPRGARVAVHLSGHGLPTTTCGEYDCGADSYHRFSARLFERTRAYLWRRVDVPVFHVYGDGGEDEDDPDDEVDSPVEAMDERRRAGFEYVVDVPYEFDADSRDTLIVLRRGYRTEPPNWNARYETTFKRGGLTVHITNSSFADRLKTRAFIQVVFDALRRALR